VIDGVDMQYAGHGAQDRRRRHTCPVEDRQYRDPLLSSDASPTGEIFNLAMEEVAEATATATSLLADKLIFLTDSQGATDSARQALLDEMTADSGGTDESRRPAGCQPDIRRYLPCARARASRAGVGQGTLDRLQRGWHAAARTVLA
jgi:amino-acid N-acetyltransferase